MVQLKMAPLKRLVPTPSVVHFIVLNLVAFSILSISPISLRLPDLTKNSVINSVQETPHFSLSLTKSQRNTSVILNDLLQSVDYENKSNPKTKKRFVLFRAIGNDLIPRHAKGQTWSNINFILKNEPAHAQLDVRWYINRLVDPEEELRVVQLLLDHNQTFTLQRLELSHYQEVPLAFSTDRYPDFLRSKLSHPSETTWQESFRKRQGLFAHLNNFIIANNPTRNAMLELGIASGAEYVLPWDGNCYITKHAWKKIRIGVQLSTNHQEVDRRLSNRYFLVPMVRMVEGNTLLLDDSYEPIETIEESQIIFRRDAEARFNTSLVYGHAPKVELIWRMQGNRTRMKNSQEIVKYMPHPSDMAENEYVANIGWVARLFSGMPGLEKRGASSLRGVSRSEGIERLVMSVAHEYAVREARFSGIESLMLYNRAELARNLNDWNEHRSSQLAPIVRRLHSMANNIMNDLKKTNADQGMRVSRNATILALAGLFTGDISFLMGSKQLLRISIFDHPVRKDANKIPIQLGGIGAHFCYTFDAARMLGATGHLSEGELQKMRAWAQAYGNRLQSEQEAVDAFFSDNIVGTLADIQAACVSAFAGDSFERLLRATNLARGRILSQFEHEASPGFQDGVRGLSAWSMLANIASKIGVDIWGFNQVHVAGGYSLGKERKKVVRPGILKAVIEVILNKAFKQRNISVNDPRLAALAWTGRKSYGTEFRLEGYGPRGSFPFDTKYDGSDDDLTPPFWNLAQPLRRKSSLP